MSEEHLSLSQGIKRCGISTAQTMLFLLILISGTSSSFSCADCPAWRPPHIVDQVLDPWQIRDQLHKKMLLLDNARKRGGGHSRYWSIKWYGGRDRFNQGLAAASIVPSVVCLLPW